MTSSLPNECFSEEFARTAKEQFGEQAEKLIKGLPSFKEDYQTWYSEAKALVRQLLPDRLSDFTRYYEKPKSRRETTYANYVIEDYLESLTITRTGGSRVVGPDAALPRFSQQLSIVNSIRERFRSSLFDIRQLAQADLFDSALGCSQRACQEQVHQGSRRIGRSSPGAAPQGGL